MVNDIPSTVCATKPYELYESFEKVMDTLFDREDIGLIVCTNWCLNTLSMLGATSIQHRIMQCTHKEALKTTFLKLLGEVLG